MRTTKFKDLPISYDEEYKMIITKLYGSSMVVFIDGRKFYISIPKNSSWIWVNPFEGMVCIVKKEKYYSGSRLYAKLTFLESCEDTYYEKENNYKETTIYDNSSKYYELLECNINSSFDEIKKNYRRLIRVYHYDTLLSKDLPSDMLEYAQNKAKMINEAYEFLKSKI